MKEQGWIEPIVERVVGEVLDSRVAQLRSEIIRRVCEEVAAGAGLVAAAASTGSAPSATELARGVAEIQTGSSQKEILKALLDVSARYANRVALFVVKGVYATGWQARGFADSDAIKDFALDENSAGISRAISERVAATVGKDEIDARFLETFGTPASGEARVCPLILKDKVAALVYADGGTQGANSLDTGAIDLLVLSTSAWLEVNSLRKQAQKEPSQTASASETHAAEAHAPAPVAQAASQAFNDPFAAHAPAFTSSKAMAAAAAETAVPSAPASSPVAPAHDGGAAEASAPSSLSAEDQEILRKAQRFARLLVDEIKLYNQAKVAEGKKNKDLYDRLKDTIEKSQATYLKRYGNTVAASENYFKHEIIRSLAEDDVSIMGANFKH
jgi:hypothetical protein